MKDRAEMLEQRRRDQAEILKRRLQQAHITGAMEMYEPADLRLEQDHLCFDPQSLAGWIQAKTDFEVYEDAAYALGDCGKQFGAFKKAMADLADEYENTSARTVTFDRLAGELVASMMETINDLRELEACQTK